MKKSVLFILVLTCSLACDDIIEVEDISNKSISVLAPTNEAVLDITNVAFSWQGIEDAETYHMQIARPTFENALQIEEDTILTTTSLIKTLEVGAYEWRVRAENSDYATAYTLQNFIIEAEFVDISSEVIVISSPVNDAIFSTTDTINIMWEAIEGANEYTIQIATPNFDNPTETITDETIADTSFSVSNLSENTYKCIIKAKNSGLETAYTEISFTVN